MKEDCIFCKIASGEIPCEKIYEDDYTIAFLDIRPNTKGHSLVIPKKHVANIYEADEETLSKTAIVAGKIASILKIALLADGINVNQNNDAPAGQAVFHLHFHIIPRFIDDGLTLWHGKDTPKEQIEETARKIKEFI
jgi:histidine triad (HIT) family protein